MPPCGDSACATDFDGQANARRAAIAKYLWSAASRRFVDWDRSTARSTPSVSAAILYPLFVGLATQDQADATAALTWAKLMAPGGLRTTTEHTGEQWDEPNGWAPLLWIGVQGLDRYGKAGLANDLAGRWLRTVSTFYACTGRMVEKYDVESGEAGGGGEYPVQDGLRLDERRHARAPRSSRNGPCDHRHELSSGLQPPVAQSKEAIMKKTGALVRSLRDHLPCARAVLADHADHMRVDAGL